MPRLWVIRLIVTGAMILAMDCAAFAQSDLSQTTDSNVDVGKSDSQPNSGGPGTTAVKSAPLSITKDELNYLEPSLEGRLARSWKYQYQLLEQPAFLIVGSGNTAQVIPNPKKWLDENSITMNFAELFPRTGNLAAMAQQYYSDASKTKQGVDLAELCGGNSHAIECLAAGGSFVERLFSGASITFSASQRNPVQQGTVLNNLPTSQGWAWSGQVNFDPSSLFSSATSVKTAITALTKMNFDLKNVADPDDCFTKMKTGVPTGTDLASCEKQFVAPGKWNKLAGIVIPKFQFQALSQFDFLKEGGVLVLDPRLQHSLKTFQFTWDLGRFIPSVTDRIAMDAAIHGTTDSSNASGGSQSKLCVTYSGAGTSYISVDHTATAHSCHLVAAALGSTTRYALACASPKLVVIGDQAVIENSDDASPPPSNDCGW